jgi:DNA-nicking Smr family endonuclease
MTKDNARIALRRFISDRQMENHQHVLVITGKGTAGKGVIRQALPNWLDEAPLSEQVVAYHTAKPKDGGTGAWYLKLRQKP